jgi:hypothetical protein
MSNRGIACESSSHVWANATCSSDSELFSELASKCCIDGKSICIDITKTRVEQPAVPDNLLCKNASRFMPNALAHWECLAPISQRLSEDACLGRGCSVPACVSEMEWVDVYGDDCQDYSDYPEWCRDAAYWGTAGVDASDVCCACGGVPTRDAKS